MSLVARSTWDPLGFCALLNILKKIIKTLVSDCPLSVKKGAQNKVHCTPMYVTCNFAKQNTWYLMEF